MNGGSRRLQSVDSITWPLGIENRMSHTADTYVATSHHREYTSNTMTGQFKVYIIHQEHRGYPSLLAHGTHNILPSAKTYHILDIE